MAERNEQLFDENGMLLSDTPPPDVAEPEQSKVAKYEKMAVQTQFKADTIAVIHNTVAKNTNLAELTYFLNVAKTSGLNPFNKEIWCYKDHRGNLIVMTGRDGFVAMSQRHDDYGGFQSHEVCENDEFDMEITNEGAIVRHKLKPQKGGRGVVLGAYCIANRRNTVPYAEWVDFTRYDKGKFTWQTHPEEMIKKVAESHALKKCFGYTGIAAAEDFEITDSGIAVPVERTGKIILNK